MRQYCITQEIISEFASYLQKEERAKATIQKYLYHVKAFGDWLAGGNITKEAVIRWKECLQKQGRCAVTVNGALAALHSLFVFLDCSELCVKYLKVQRQTFRDTARELSKQEYLRLVRAAEQKGDMRLSLLLETVCGTGVRVSEVRYITVEAIKKGRVDVALKGKIRTILIPEKLCRKLLGYVKKQKIAFGEVFITKSGKGLSRGQIWSAMKNLCRVAGVEEGKVYPHNLRHLFARMYYQFSKDIVRLADILGHSSVETTRIYLISTGAEHRQELEQLGLIL